MNGGGLPVPIPPSTPCVEWTRSLTRDGYGQRWFGGKVVLAHRAAWIEQVGPIPEAMTLDHLCRNRACVRVDHLEVVTAATNVLRGMNPAAENARKTRCVNGHPFDEGNTGWRAEGGRFCRTCKAASEARRPNRAAEQHAAYLRRRAAA